MKKLCNASAIAAFLTAVCFTAVSCNKTPSESTLPVEKELGVSIELTSATETSVSVDITAEKDAEGYIYAIIGGVGPDKFYASCCGATTIEGSSPGWYRNIL